MSLANTTIIVTGAGSVLGRDILQGLAEGKATRDKVIALDASANVGEDLTFADDTSLAIQNSDSTDFAGAKIVLHAGLARDAAGLARRANAAGAVFIDGSGAFAFDPDVPLVVPEVNGEALQSLKKNVVANPNSLSIFLALALHPLHRNAGVTRVVASTYQAVSHWGRAAQDELFSQTKAMFMAQTVNHKHMPKQIAFNCYPLLGEERDDGLTDVEFHTMGMVKKILDTKIRLAINTVTVPCFVGDGLMVNVECRDDITPIKAALWMTGQKGLGVLEDIDSVPTHNDISGEAITYVARLRPDISVENGVAFWLMGDNLRKGSALNMVDIAKALLKGN